MSNEKKEILQSFNFIELWQNYKQQREEQWDEHFNKLIKFFKKHGKLPSRNEDCFLEPWVFRQRRMLKKGLLSKEQKLKFEKAGINLLKRSFKRRFKNGQTWDGYYEAVKDFIKDNGKFPKYTSYPSIERAMLQWCSNQKRAIRNGRLPDEKIKKFQSLFA